MRRCKNCGGLVFAAFGAGLLLATICPVQLILVLAAAALVLTGFCLVRN
ncbi:MAG TPA: hypothetical protein PKX71_00280 [Candidatus Avimonas sp.]|nr:hypothetical protein [Clostridiales bacterium]HOB35886.1 hypothetical protein [Candidatus Avimonas sp.]HQA15382.1 hypothetical protein [Candidatus Avimonas sp.]HQD37342.1 hypothetical protein [Candidatus Avimonas sp.]